MQPPVTGNLYLDSLTVFEALKETDNRTTVNVREQSSLNPTLERHAMNVSTHRRGEMTMIG
jgi:hypothetical protein